MAVRPAINSTSLPTEEGEPDVYVLRTSVRDEDAPKAPSGEITPLLPNLEKLDGHDVLVQDGWFDSQWVRPWSRRLTSGVLETLLKECEDKAKGAVYAALPEDLMTAGAVKWLAVVLKRGYKFHHYHTTTDEAVYYLWCKKEVPDMVPAYATSIEGGGVLVLSPDEEEVLLVRNRGWHNSHWARVGGAVNAGESCLEGALRECKEETKVIIDTTFLPRLAVCYNQPRARDQEINDHFMLFIVRALGKDIRPDEGEVIAAQWFNIATLVEAWKGATAGLDEEEDLPKSINVEAVGTDAILFGSTEMLALERWANGTVFTEKKIGGRMLY